MGWFFMASGVQMPKVESLLMACCQIKGYNQLFDHI